MTTLADAFDAAIDHLDLDAEAAGGRVKVSASGQESRAGSTPVRIVRDESGVLSVEAGPPSGRSKVSRGGGRVEWETRLPQLERSMVGDHLTKLDRRLTPNQGLRVLDLDSGVWRPDATAVPEGRILLFVHGTFSNGDSFTRSIAANPDGSTFWAWVREHYDQVLSYDHPTLQVSPMINAHLLAVALDGSRAAIDVVAHSRGGLVARWWLEALRPDPAPQRRAVLVGSPLAGDRARLAAPYPIVAVTADQRRGRRRRRQRRDPIHNRRDRCTHGRDLGDEARCHVSRSGRSSLARSGSDGAEPCRRQRRTRSLATHEHLRSALRRGDIQLRDRRGGVAVLAQLPS